MQKGHKHFMYVLNVLTYMNIFNQSALKTTSPGLSDTASGILVRVI